MIGVKVLLKDIEQFRHFFTVLPDNVIEAIMGNLEKYQNFLRQIMARNIGHSGKSATGYTASRMFVTKGQNSVTLSIDSPYAAAQEFGFKPHWIPIEYLKQHKEFPGSRGEWVKNPKGFVVVKKFTPFVEKSIEESSQELRRLMVKSLKSSIEKSKK